MTTRIAGGYSRNASFSQRKDSRSKFSLPEVSNLREAISLTLWKVFSMNFARSRNLPQGINQKGSI
jgi:hypothetical protein